MHTKSIDNTKHMQIVSKKNTFSNNRQTGNPLFKHRQTANILAIKFVKCLSTIRQWPETYGVTSYGSGCRKDVVD